QKPRPGCFRCLRPPAGGGCRSAPRCPSPMVPVSIRDRRAYHEARRRTPKPDMPGRPGGETLADRPEPENPPMPRLIPLEVGLALPVALPGCHKHPPPAPAAPATPAAAVKAGDLLNEYRTNTLAADAKYKGKLLQVSGKFTSVSKVPLTERYVLQLAAEDAGD